jgi:hypothetical protein
MANEVEAYRATTSLQFKGTNGFMITVDISSKDVASSKGVLSLVVSASGARQRGPFERTALTSVRGIHGAIRPLRSGVRRARARNAALGPPLGNVA